MSTFPQHHDGIELRLVWETHPNPDYQTLHCTWPVPEMHWISKDKMSPEAKALQDRIQARAGVVEASSCQRYQIGVKKGFAFSFSDVRQQVEAIMREFFGVPAASVTLPESTYGEEMAAEARAS